MRTLGLALVVTALVFTTGGVAIVGRADTKLAPGDAGAQRSVAPAQSRAVDPLLAPAAKKLSGQCAPLKTTPQPKLYRSAKQSAPRAAFPKGAIPLNTRGYNYGATDLPQLPPGATPASAVPAAPAKP